MHTPKDKGLNKEAPLSKINIKMFISSQARQYTPWIPALGKAEAGGISEFKASSVHRKSTRTAREPCFGKQKLFHFTRMGILPSLVSVYHACVVPAEVRRQYRVPWDWIHSWFRVSMCVLGIEPKSSAKATSTHDRCLVSLGPRMNKLHKFSVHYFYLGAFDQMI